MAADIHALLKKRLQDSCDDYVADLDALSGDQLNTSPGGAARIAYDYTYEVAFINRRVAARMRGDSPPPMPNQKWITAPDEFKVKGHAMDEIKGSVDDVLTSWSALTPDELDREIELPNGSKTSPIDLMFLAIFHTGYHDAQLNYLQSLLGDDEVHWK